MMEQAREEIDVVRKWKEYLSAERRFSPLTVRAYTDDVYAFIDYTESEEYDPSRTTLSDLRSYIMMLMERGDNPRSVNRHISALRSFFRYLLRSEIIESDPTAKLKALPQKNRLPQFIPQNKGKEIIHRLMEWSDDPEDQRDHLIVLLLITTGMRRAELATLRVENVNLDQKIIKVLGKRSKERIIPLSHKISEIMERYFRENPCLKGEKFLFLNNGLDPITTDDIYRIVKRILGEFGVQGKASPHTLRHTFATYLMSEGVSIRSIQELLGHESLSSTGLYTHNTIEGLKESYKKAHPRAKKL